MAPPAASSNLSVPAFLKLLTTGGVGLSTSEAMGAASALIKAGYNKADVANPFVGISEISLVSAGVTDPETRKQLVAYGRTGKGRKPTTIRDVGGQGQGKKRKSRESDLDRPLPVKAEERVALSLDFEEVMEDFLLHDRSLVINRAPVMTAWATVVAERLGFNRQEALSIAHTYTNMNATAKGVSLGIYSPENGKQRTTVGPSQPYVELMGRKVPMLALQNGEWRGIANGAIAEPEQAFGYIQRSFRQHMSAAIGALRLLADTIDPDELNKIGFNLYAEFRPEVQGWGERGQLHLGKVLDLRRGADGAVKSEEQKPADETTRETERVGQVVDEDTVKLGDSDQLEANSASSVPIAKVEPSETTVIDNMEPATDPTGQEIRVKAEEDDAALPVNVIAHHTSTNLQAESIPTSIPPGPAAKKIKVEQVTEEEDWDDGGINDDDLASLV